MHILVVEDEKRLASRIRQALEEESHVVDVSYDGAEALEMAQATDYDLLILDLM
ncbi:MAG: response regulator, partial [Chloroflexi bacterium]|nr:response regulator [Chloroflexota bacterium]